MEWISVEDRLPEKTELVLVNAYFGVHVAYYRPSGKFFKRYNAYCRLYEDEMKPTHWMPLPDPPEDE